MKIINLFALTVMISCMLVSACGHKYIDKEIKADLVSKAKEDVNFAGLMFTVFNGNVAIWGKCASERSKQLVKTKIKTIHMINHINEQIIVGNVKLDADYNQKLKIDGVLVNYPGVAASVSRQVISLIGYVEPDRYHELLKDMRRFSSDIDSRKLQSNLRR
ncbi:hypothetical protein [Pedobacter terrae]|uniref:hypothetical protein n=1 Tax=Pedobacter terrae TaxID=405671 RepID=UPI002FF5CF76